jgi:hypothetical protein
MTDQADKSGMIELTRGIVKAEGLDDASCAGASARDPKAGWGPQTRYFAVGAMPSTRREFHLAK